MQYNAEFIYSTVASESEAYSSLHFSSFQFSECSVIVNAPQCHGMTHDILQRTYVICDEFDCLKQLTQGHRRRHRPRPIQ